MELLLSRLSSNDICSQGFLSVLSADPSSEPLPRLHTLELPVKDGSHGWAIPEGVRFKMALLPSPKFMRSSDPWVMRYAKQMPHILEVPGRSDVMAHWGNDVRATEGCPLVGLTKQDNFIGSSRLAFTKLYDAIYPWITKGDCFITIRNELRAL